MYVELCEGSGALSRDGGSAGGNSSCCVLLLELGQGTAGTTTACRFAWKLGCIDVPR